MWFLLVHSPLVGPATWSPMRVPVGCDAPGAFLLLSEAYRRDANTASSLGWPVVEHLGRHLDIVNAPELLAEALVGLLR